MTNESELLRHMKALSQRRLAEKHKVERGNSVSWENNTAVGNLRRDKAKAENELAAAQEREALIHVEETELARQKLELDARIEHLERVNRETVEPRVNGLRKDITRLEEGMQADKATGTALAREREKAQGRIAALCAERADADQNKVKYRQLLAREKTNPEKVRKQGDVVLAAKGNLEKELARQVRDTTGVDADLNAQLARKKELEDERVNIVLYLESQREDYDGRDRVTQELMNNLEVARDEARIHTDQGGQLDRDIRDSHTAIRNENEILLRTQREKDAVLKQVRRRENQLASVESLVPSLVEQSRSLGLDLEALRRDRKRNKAQLRDLRDDVDVFIHSYLDQEALEGAKGEALRRAAAEVRALEAEVSTLAAEEHRLQRDAAALAVQREVRARDAARASRQARQALEDLKTRNIRIADLSKQYSELGGRLRELQGLYDVVKNERNKYVNVIQSCAQTIAEMKEKVKILGNEVEILRGESADLDRALERNRAETAQSVNVRDALRTETNRCLYECRARQGEVDQGITQIDKLNAIITLAEEGMLRLKRLYESAVEDRNFAGIQLIDRNDELCVLYEKLNVQEQVMRNGEVEFRRLEEEARLLRIEERDVSRSIEVLRNRLPEIPKTERLITTLQQELTAERGRSAQLSADLESPLNDQRWRALGGRDPSPEELAAKIQGLEAKLNTKREQLLEKELILDEVTNLSNRLRKRASNGRGDTLELSKRVNAFQGQIRDATRKMMGVVAELSIYQATSARLGAEKEELEATVDQARERLELGQPPTEDAEREWYRLERERLLQRERNLVRAEQARAGADGGDLPPGSVRTTAEPRPNAYIPEGLGLPRPYGGWAPLKPTVPGASMRHTRKPAPLKDIEI
jgi:chromosome segregation ATPase